MDWKIAVVIPCYKERDHILGVIERIPLNVMAIYCVDDCCPLKTGEFVADHCRDERVATIFNPENLGVGGAVIAGYERAMREEMDIVVKIDGDGQMDPTQISDLVQPILAGKADYTKCNRFFQLELLDEMPSSRLVGNVVLAFLSKLSSGYWSVFDPTNGFTAIHTSALRLLPLDNIDNRYFFESDMLFRLGTIRAVVYDVPQRAIYASETSHLNVLWSIPEFTYKHVKNTFKRIFYNYFLRDSSVASIELILGPLLLLFGTIFGLSTWITNASLQITTPTGTIMIIVLSLVMGLQMLLSAFQFDVQNQPRIPLQTLLNIRK